MMFEAGNWDVEDVLREQFGLKYVVEPLFVFFVFVVHQVMLPSR